MGFEGRSKIGSLLAIPAVDKRLSALPAGSEEGSATAAPTYRIAKNASLLGLSGYQHDAARIIMAAQIRLRALRSKHQTPEIRDTARRITRARDMLLRTAAGMQPAPESPR